MPETAPAPVPPAVDAPLAAAAGGPSPAPAKKKPLWRRIVRRVFRTTVMLASFGFIAVLALTIWILWFFPNGIVASTVETQAASLGFAVDIGLLDVRPLEGFNVENFTLDVEANRAAGAPPLLSVGALKVRWNAKTSLRERRVHIQSVDVENPRLTVHQAGGVWNVQRVLDTLMPPLPAGAPTPEPTPTPKSVPIEEQIAMQVAFVDSMLAMIPVPVDLDLVHVVGVGANVVTEAGTIARVDGIAADVTLHLSSGGGIIEVKSDPQLPITIALQPGGGTGFSGTIRAKSVLTLDLTDTITFGADVKLDEAVAMGGGIELPLTVAAKGYGMVDIPVGDLTLVAEQLDIGEFLEAKGSLDVDGLGVKGIHASWSSGVDGKQLPGFITDTIVSSSGAKSVNPGMTMRGSLEGALETADPAAIQASIAKGRLPLTLKLESSGATSEGLIALDGISVGKLAHTANVDVTPERVALSGGLDVTKIRLDPLLEGKPFDVSVRNQTEISANLDTLLVKSVAVKIPQTGVAIDGRATVRGLNGATAAWLAATAKTLDTVPSALAAITVLKEIDAGGTFRLSAPKEIEVADGAFLKGSIVAKGAFLRKSDPYGRLTAQIDYEDFGARVAGTSSTGAPADALLVEGMTAHLTLDRELILGGKIEPKKEEQDVTTDEAAVFDPATRGYYDRLGSLRAETDNFRIARIVAGPIKIRDLSAEVLYDGGAIHVNRGRMQLLGGEVVGRMIIRPTVEGLHIATAGDLSGIDMSPLLLEKPLEDPNDTRVHMSSAASFFLSKDDPIASLADMRMRLDVTAAGSKVLDTLLAWLDPEFKDPMFNWARSVNKKVVGLTRPQFSAVADHGMYDVTIAFPSLGVSKDVKRIPLTPLFNLRFTKDIIGGLAPPGNVLPLLAARGIDGTGNIVLPPPPPPPD